MVRDKLLNHALRTAMQDLIPLGRYAAYVLYLQCDPKTVDVNVHPTKHEVRFEQARLIHDFIHSAIERTLKPINYSIDAVESNNAAYYVREATVNYQPVVLDHQGKFGKPIAQIKTYYVLSETENGLIIIDLRATQKILFEEQLKKTLIKQPILLPITVKISAEKIKKLVSLSLENVGIELQQISDCGLVLRALPNILKDVDAEVLLQELAITDDPIDCIAKLAANIPRHLSHDEMQTVLRQLEVLPELPEKFVRVVELV